MVPRHQTIVEDITSASNPRALTVLIGCGEIALAIWILSRYKIRWSAITQIALVLIMNIIEFVVSPHLLLWGKWNSVFALAFIVVVYYYAFILPKHSQYHVSSS
jgi:K+-sensing histidine kinase KdpD